MKTRLSHIHLFVRDLERARHFYSSALGLVVLEQRPGACYLGSGDGAYQLGLFEHRTDSIEAPLAIGCRAIAFEVPSTAGLLAVCDRLLGARFTAIDSPGRVAIHTTDPDGNRLEIFCRTSADDAAITVRPGQTRTLNWAELRALNA